MTKKIFAFLVAVSIAAILWAQSPDKMSYQAIIRNSSNQLVADKEVGMRISILQGSASGTAIYSETYTLTTNTNGLISIIIGGESGFDAINWANGPYFLKTEVAVEKPLSSYTIEGITELLSVPFAFHAATSSKAEMIFDGKNAGEMIYWDGHAWIAIEPGEHDQTMMFCDGRPTWGPCPERYMLTLLSDPPDGGVASGGGEFGEGRIIQVSAIPDVEFKFANWKNQSGDIINTKPSFDFTMPAQNVILTAIFTEKDKFVDGEAGAGVTDIDGTEYKTVYIGSQEWMAENLKTGKFADGTEIPFGISEEDQQTAAAYAVFNYPVDDLTSEEIFDMYGGLYNWYAVSDPRGLCPAGWRVPDESDWNQLANHMMSIYSLHNDMYSSSPNALGNALKSCRQVGSPLGEECNTSDQPRWTANSIHYGTNMVNFNAIPGGTISDLPHSQAQESAFWWTSNPENNDQARLRYLFIETGPLVNSAARKQNGFSIRCIKD
jgi:uncharacterized protein (TIGR02145 family)